MSVYVDPIMNHGWRLGPSCHLCADTDDELHAFAARIGMRRSWFQISPRGLRHYDLTVRRRADAVRQGAIELDRAAAVAKWRELRGEVLTHERRKDE